MKTLAGFAFICCATLLVFGEEEPKSEGKEKFNPRKLPGFKCPISDDDPLATGFFWLDPNFKGSIGVLYQEPCTGWFKIEIESRSDDHLTFKVLSHDGIQKYDPATWKLLKPNEAAGRRYMIVLNKEGYQPIIRLADAGQKHAHKPGEYF